MKAVRFTDFGEPGVLGVSEAPDPVMGPYDVLIRVEATGVCYHDLLHRAGSIPRSNPGTILGHEVSGVVERTGEHTVLAPGSRVVVYNRLSCRRCRDCLAGRHDLCRQSRLLGSTAPGGYAELMAVPEWAAIPIPDAMSHPDAALAVCPIGTSVKALTTVGGVGPGDVVLITGATGGLGLHQIQIAAALGARVIGVTRSDERREALELRGAEVVVIDPDSRLRHEVREVVGDGGVDVVVENVTSHTLTETMWNVRAGGRIVVLGNISMEDVQINPGLVIERRLSIIGSGNPTFEDVRRAIALIESDAVRPEIDRVMPFDSAARAHELVESGTPLGRIVLSGWR